MSNVNINVSIKIACFRLTECLKKISPGKSQKKKKIFIFFL